MVKHRKSKACTSSVHKKGHFIEVKARCHVGKAKLVTPSMCKHLPRSTKEKTKTIKKIVRHKVTEVPAACKGLKKKARKECAKKVCAQQPAEYRQECYKRAGIR